MRPSAPKHTGEGIGTSGVTVSSTVGLADFVPKNQGQSHQKPAGGRMNNDIRRPGRGPRPTLTPAKENPDRIIAETKYDVAESDEDYKKLNSLIAEDDMFVKSADTVTAEDNSIPDAPDASFDEADSTESEPSAPVFARERDVKEAISEDEMNFALEFANTLLKNMQLEAHAEAASCPDGEEFTQTDEEKVYPKINIVGDDTGILIGHHGETLDAIQYLVNLSSLRKSKSKDGDYVKIVVDIENYREKREGTLRTLARRMASRAVKYKRNVFLEPMNAYERRIIHSELQNYPDVSTHSVGTDRDRKIIITYEGADKQPDNRDRVRRRPKNNDSVSEPVSRAPETPEEKQARLERRQNRRPKKIAKVPIEQLTDVLGNHGLADFDKETDTASPDTEE